MALVDRGVGTGDEADPVEYDDEPAQTISEQELLSRSCGESGRPRVVSSRLTLLRHRVLFSGAWLWRTLGLRLLILLGILSVIYGVVIVLWIYEIVEKCRIPYHEKIQYNSYFGGGLRLISKNQTQQLTLLPGLACVPELETDYVTATWEDFMEVINHLATYL